MTKYLALDCWLIGTLLSSVAQAGPVSHNIIFDATLVASTCNVVVESGARHGHLTFPVYDKSVGTQPLLPIDFSLVVYEENASEPGCSAFDVGSHVSIVFGDSGQLDEQGVITKGAGDGIRIGIQAIDNEADYKGLLNAMNHIVSYDARFASAGRFKYQAELMNMPSSQAGAYQGTLSFLVTYQ